LEKIFIKGVPVLSPSIRTAHTARDLDLDLCDSELAVAAHTEAKWKNGYYQVGNCDQLLSFHPLRWQKHGFGRSFTLASIIATH
jgi:hypothetical protein